MLTGFGYDYDGVEAERRVAIDLAMNLTGVVVSAVLNLQVCRDVFNLEPSFWMNLTGDETSIENLKREFEESAEQRQRQTRPEQSRAKETRR